MALGSKTVARRLELALAAGSLAKDHSSAVEAVILADLAPHFDEGRTPPEIRYLLELFSRGFASLSASLSTADYERQAQSSLTKFQKDRERAAAQEVRNLLADVRYLLDRTLGKEKTGLHFEGRSALVKMSFPVLVRVGEKLITLMRDETVGWTGFPVGDHLPTRALLSSKLEAALAELKVILEAGRPNRNALSHTSANWKREREQKNLRLRRRIKLLQAFLVDAGFELEAAALQPKTRKSSSPTEGGKSTSKMDLPPMAESAISR